MLIIINIIYKYYNFKRIQEFSDIEMKQMEIRERGK